jgi:hypothetical protein
VVATLAHNLLRWVAALGLGARQELVVAKTLRRTLLNLPGRLTHSAHRLILHLPAGWPWAAWFALALARLRCSLTIASGPGTASRQGRQPADKPPPISPAEPQPVTNSSTVDSG